MEYTKSFFYVEKPMQESSGRKSIQDSYIGQAFSSGDYTVERSATGRAVEAEGWIVMVMGLGIAAYPQVLEMAEIIQLTNYDVVTYVQTLFLFLFFSGYFQVVIGRAENRSGIHAIPFGKCFTIVLNAWLVATCKLPWKFGSFVLGIDVLVWITTCLVIRLDQERQGPCCSTDYWKETFSIGYEFSIPRNMTGRAIEFQGVFYVTLAVLGIFLPDLFHKARIVPMFSDVWQNALFQSMSGSILFVGFLYFIAGRSEFLAFAFASVLDRLVTCILLLIYYTAISRDPRGNYLGRGLVMVDAIFVIVTFVILAKSRYS